MDCRHMINCISECSYKEEGLDQTVEIACCAFVDKAFELSQMARSLVQFVSKSYFDA